LEAGGVVVENWRLTALERRRLQKRLHETGELSEYRRIVALLAIADGVPVAEVSQWLGVTRQCIYQWRDRFHDASGGPSCLLDLPRSGRPPLWDEDALAVLQSAIQILPDELGYPALNWTVELLQEHMEAGLNWRPSEASLREQLHRLGYVWKRPRYVLEPDSQREKKTRVTPLFQRAPSRCRRSL
jgi:transposase